MEEMVATFPPFFLVRFVPLHPKSFNLIIEERMKRKLLLLVFCGLMSTAMADWTYGTASFMGSPPSSSMSVGGVMIWYNGSLSQTGNEGGVQIWEGTGDICVVYPKNYNGPKCASCQKVELFRYRLFGTDES